MRLIDLTCSKCGALLKVDSTVKKVACEYCGNEMLIDDEIKHISFDNGYDFGYQMEKGKLQARIDTYNKYVDDIKHRKETELQNKLAEEHKKKVRLIRTPTGQKIKRLYKIRTDSELFEVLKCNINENFKLKDEYEKHMVSKIYILERNKPKIVCDIIDWTIEHYKHCILAIIISVLLIIGSMSM